MSVEEPLEMYDLIVNTVAGNVEIFVFLAIAFISSISAKFNMPKEIFMLMLALFGILFSNYIGGLYLIILLLAGFSIFYSISKIFR